MLQSNWGKRGEPGVKIYLGVQLVSYFKTMFENSKHGCRCVNIVLFMCILFSKIWFMNFRSRYGVVSSAIWSFFKIIVMFWNSDASVIFCDFKTSDCWFEILGQKNIVELWGVPIELMDYFVPKFRWKLFYQSVKTLRILKFFVSHYHTFGG